MALTIPRNVKRTAARKSRLAPVKPEQSGDHLVMTKEMLDYAVEASKRILKDAAEGKLPRYV